MMVEASLLRIGLVKVGYGGSAAAPRETDGSALSAVCLEGGLQFVVVASILSVKLLNFLWAAQHGPI